ncbi:helix-turn-helix transcriptional regulator [Kocuria rosea]|uniref:helix-turn-helix transcriptional regulator n=1 Tax=Kocuria rosea TaxID=1275 RepID=UPI00203BF0A6|nr:helix-turn-helix domain-containing protein [Kocuria rosea]
MNRVTVKEAAEASGLSTRTIQNMLTDGRLTRYKLAGGRAVRVDLDELTRLFRAE